MKQSNVKSNFVLTLSYNILHILIPFVTTPYIARMLGAENLGIYSYSYSAAYIFVIFALLGLNNYGNRTIASVRDDKEKLSRTFWDIYYMQLGLSVIVLSAYVVYINIFCEYRLIAVLLIFYVISAAFDVTWFFFGIEYFKFTVIRNLVVKVLNLAAILLFVKKPDDLWLYTLIMALGSLASQLFLWTVIRKYVGFRKPNYKRSVSHLKPNLILFIPVIAISIYHFMDKIMLGNLSNMEQVGFYDNAEKIITIPQTAVTALGTVMLPRVSNMMTTGNQQGAVNYLKKSIILVAAISSACTFGIISVAPEFVHIYLGKGFETCITLLYYLMPCLIFKAYANVIRTQYLIPLKKDKIYVTSVCIGAVVNLVFNLIFIPHFQAVGACIGTILAEIIVCLYQMRFIVKEQKVGKYFLYGFVFQGIGAVMFFVLCSIPFSGSRWIILIEKIVLGGIIYLAFSALYFITQKKKLFS